MATSKKQRLIIFNKYGGRCAYCGNPITLKDFQVDHYFPKRCNNYYRKQLRLSYIDPKERFNAEDISNKMPSCKTCNHYKHSEWPESWRVTMKTLHTRIKKHYINRVAMAYGIIPDVVPFDGIFYFEKIDNPAQ